MTESKILISDLRKGDVLLSYGPGKLADLVKSFDGGDYSHASLCQDADLIEAGLGGVVSYPISDLVAEQRYVDAFRFVSDDSQLMGTEKWPANPILEIARGFLEAGTAYANNQLYLAGVLVLTRKLPLGEIGRAATRALMAALFKLLRRIISGKETRSVVCSELVYSSFYEALPQKKYGLSIKGTIQPAANLAAHTSQPALQVNQDFVAELEKELRAIELASGSAHRLAAATGVEGEEQSLADFLGRPLEDQLSKLNGQYQKITRGGFHMARANPWVAAGMVSPRDLQHSPNLRLIGRLDKQS